MVVGLHINLKCENAVCVCCIVGCLFICSLSYLWMILNLHYEFGWMGVDKMILLYVVERRNSRIWTALHQPNILSLRHYKRNRVKSEFPLWKGLWKIT